MKMGAATEKRIRISGIILMPKKQYGLAFAKIIINIANALEISNIAILEVVILLVSKVLINYRYKNSISGFMHLPKRFRFNIVSLLTCFVFFGSHVIEAKQIYNPDTIRTGIFVKSLFNFNSTDFSYDVDCWVWFKGKKRFIVPEKEVEIANAKSFVFSAQSYDTVKDETGVVWYWTSFNCKATIIQNWDLRHFPFDKQVLKVVIESSDLDMRELIFVQDNIHNKIFDNNLDHLGWRRVGRETALTSAHRYSTTFGDPSLSESRSLYPNIAFNINLARNSFGLFFKLFMGCYVAFFVTVLVFFIRPIHVDPRFGLSIGALFAAVGNMYVVDANVPDSLSFGLIDQIHIVTFFYILLSMMISIRSLQLFESKRINNQIQLDKISLYLFLSTYIIINFILIGIANEWWSK